MAKIPVSLILADFRRMLQEHWAYVAGGAAVNAVDCSGAFVWAYRQHGGSIYHGSNRIARAHVVRLMPIGSVTLVPGMAAFKCRQQGQAGYSLPSAYQTGGSYCNGDLGDYYHIGLVGDDTSQVLNAQSTQTGFVASPVAKGWTHVAYLADVDYGGESGQWAENSGQWTVGSGQTEGATSGMTATVVAENGGTVNLRKKPDTHGALVERVPVGATVEVTGAASGGWYSVRWGKYSGWMMSDFLAMQSTGEMVGGGVSAEQPPVTSQGDPEGVQGGDRKAPLGNWAVTIYDLAESEARELAALYPSANVFETVG